MLSKRFKFILKSFLNKAASASLVALLLLCGTVSKIESVKIHADTNVQINPFVWLCSYFGINIYTDAQEINEAFYTAIQDAYNVWMLTQQPQQQMSIDDIISSISWDEQEPKMLKITGAAFNALKSFANYLDSKVTTASEALAIGTFELDGPASYFIPYNTEVSLYHRGSRDYKISVTNENTRCVFAKYTNGDYFVSAVSLTSQSNNVRFYNAYNGNWYTYSTNNSLTSNGVTFYYSTMQMSDGTPLLDAQYTTISGSQDAKNKMLDYTFGSSSSSGETTLNDIYALPEQAVLDDLIGASDPESDVSIDIEDSDIPWSTAATLQDILDAINSLTDTYVLDNSWPETIGKTIAQSIAIDNELTDVDYPDAITWQVPDLIGTPVITPLIEPECPTLSACLVAGIEDVGATMNSVIESNSNVSNYVSASLFLGLSLMILGAFI